MGAKSRRAGEGTDGSRYLFVSGLAERVGFEPTENFDILDRFQDDSVMTTPAPLPAFLLYYTLRAARLST